MNRFMGMMPSAEIEKEARYKDSNNLTVTIQAGPNGWTIVWADGGTNYKDETKTTEENFQEALDTAVGYIGNLTEITDEPMCSASEC